MKHRKILARTVFRRWNERRVMSAKGKRARPRVKRVQYIYIYESEWTKSTTSTISFAHIKSSHINASLLRFLAYSTWANVLCARVRLFIENFTKMALFCEQNKYTERESERGRETIYLSLWCIFHFAVWLRISLTHHLFLIIIIVAHFFSSFYFFHIYIFFLLNSLLLFCICVCICIVFVLTTQFPESDQEEMAKRAEKIKISHLYVRVRV